MQDTEETDVCSEVPGIGSHFEQRFRAGAKQQIIDPALVLER
jgi:hypothetical protein